MKTTKVWDLFVRLFHWSLVISVFSQLATAEDYKSVHVKVGIFILAILTIRILWGFVGTKHARFKDFIYPPAQILAYLKGLLQGRPKHYTGHNPAGGAMVCALLLCLLLTGLTGLLTYTSRGNQPLSTKSVYFARPAFADDDDHRENEDRLSHSEQRGNNVDQDQAGLWKEIHESLAGASIFLIIIHFCGVIASSYVHRENLILAMITGKKKVPH